MTDEELRHHPSLQDYPGPFPEAQYKARHEAEELVRQVDGHFVSRQSYAVLQVLIDEIERLKERVHELEQAVWRGR